MTSVPDNGKPSPSAGRGRDGSGAAGWLAALLLAAAMALAACGAGSGEGLESTPNCIGGVLEPSWGCIQDFVFTPSCAKSGCHLGGGAPFALRLDEANSPNIVNRESGEQPPLKLIEPGDPDASYLILKVEGDPSISFARMPADGPPFLDATTIQIMRNWVTLGAPVP